jgi:hypothetical protein
MSYGEKYLRIKSNCDQNVPLDFIIPFNKLQCFPKEKNTTPDTKRLVKFISLDIEQNNDNNTYRYK